MGNSATLTVRYAAASDRNVPFKRRASAWIPVVPHRKYRPMRVEATHGNCPMPMMMHHAGHRKRTTTTTATTSSPLTCVGCCLQTRAKVVVTSEEFAGMVLLDGIVTFRRLRQCYLRSCAAPTARFRRTS